jgi:hypothetical protein
MIFLEGARLMMWLNHHPTVEGAIVIVAIVVVAAWWLRPVTWRDGEGPLIGTESDMDVRSGWFGRFLLRRGSGRPLFPG